MEIHETSHEGKSTENQKPNGENEDGNAEEEEEEEEETLSLRDLPVDDNQTRHRDDQSPACSRTEEDFDFGSWSHSVPREPEMCAADDVFFKGQILPLRFSGDGCPGSRPEFRRSISRSESMDHASISRLTSLHSSRSSSTRSCHSSTTTTSSCSATNSNPTRIRNNFHTHPSPKPQIRPSKTWPGSRNPNPRTQKSTLWDFLKLGLIRAPEIELQDLKARNSFSNNRISVSRNSSWSSNSSGGGSGSIKNHPHNQEPKQGNFVQAKRSTVGLFGGCKCSVDAIQTAVLNDGVLMKSCKRSENIDDVEEKVMMLKKDEKGNEKEKMKRRGKQGLSRRRTSDWLRDLSHVTYGDD